MSEQVRLKVTLQVTPQSRGMSVRGVHVPQELTYDKVLTLHGGVKRYGPFLLKGPPADLDDYATEGYHWARIPLDGIDTTKCHLLFVEFDDKYDWPGTFEATGFTFAYENESRSFGLIAARKGLTWTGGNNPIPHNNGQRWRLDRDVSLDLSGFSAIGTLEHHGLWWTGPVLLLNPIFGADECDIYVVIVNGGSLNVSEKWGQAMVTMVELAEGWEDLYAIHPEMYD